MEDLALVTAANVLERLKVGLSGVWFGTATTAAAAARRRAGWEEELGLTDLGRFLHFRKIGPEGFFGRAGRRNCWHDYLRTLKRYEVSVEAEGAMRNMVKIRRFAVRVC